MGGVKGRENGPYSPPLGQVAILIALGVVAVSGAFAAALSATEAVPQIIGFCTLISVSLLALLQQMRTTVLAEQAALKGDDAANRVEQVKETLASTANDTKIKLDSLGRVAEQTRTLVNGHHLVALKLNAELSRWKYEQTMKEDHPEHERAAEYKRAAELAERVYREQEAKQGPPNGTAIKS